MKVTRRGLLIGGAAVAGTAVTGGGVALLGSNFGWFGRPTVRAAAPTKPRSITTIASGLRAPWGLAFLPDGTALVTERDTTRIVRVDAGGKVTEVQRIAEAKPRGEGGLMGIAVAPDQRLYIHYTAADDNRVARLTLGEAPQPILTGLPKAGNHNGGRIAFGPDGMLYVGTGDAAERNRSQELGNLGGKILRITADGKPAPGNPFGDSPVYSYGHRNVQGLAWDPAGKLYAAEFGQNAYDELNLIEPGRNYGWPEVEGRGSNGKYTNPIATWSTDDASPSGIAYHGGHIYLACLRGEKLYRVGTDGQNAAVLLGGTHGRLRHVAAAPDGSLWVLTSNHDGRGSPSRDDDRILRLEV